MTDRPRDRIGRWTETNRPAPETDSPLEPAVQVVEKRGRLGDTYTLTPGVFDDEAIDWYDSHDRLALAVAVARTAGTNVVVQTVEKGSGDRAEVVTGAWGLRDDGYMIGTESDVAPHEKGIGLGVHSYTVTPDEAISRFDPSRSEDYDLAETFARPLIGLSFQRTRRQATGDYFPDPRS